MSIANGKLPVAKQGSSIIIRPEYTSGLLLANIIVNGESNPIYYIGQSEETTGGTWSYIWRGTIFSGTITTWDPLNDRWYTPHSFVSGKETAYLQKDGTNMRWVFSLMLSNGLMVTPPWYLSTMDFSEKVLEFGKNEVTLTWKSDT